MLFLFLKKKKRKKKKKNIYYKRIYESEVREGSVFVWKKNIKGKEKNIQMAIIHRSVSVTNLRLYNRV